jgi:hypothetical protein
MISFKRTHFPKDIILYAVFFDSPALCIRLPAKKVFNLNDYVAKGILTVSQSQILHNAVMDRKNILLGGGTGSGKTTLANALLDVISVTGDRKLFWPAAEYIVQDCLPLAAWMPGFSHSIGVVYLRHWGYRLK